MFTRRDAFWLSASLLPLPLIGRIGTADEPAPKRPKTLNDEFPFTPPKTKEEWAKRRKVLREQVFVSQGLWPLPEKSPLNAVIHGKIERAGYTIEKVSFASMPGHYVTGNLYRPTGESDGKRPGVLSPHGHWPNGRFYEAPESNVTRDLGLGAEADRVAATYPLQARCANLAMLGFVVFHYDMIGYADSTIIPHREGFKDAAAELRLQSFMGLQTWNGIRALDFISGLPDVNPDRISVTGASGGGTQTFLLCAVDDRPAAAFPAVMVSTAMQGGCVCENASYLRIDTGNVELAGLFAPKPLALSGADDWTKEIMTQGFPELKQLYTLLGAPDHVAAKAWLKFPHNFGRPSREFMASWFSTHLLGKPGEVTEKPFVPVPPNDLSVYNADHPRPSDELPADKLRETMAKASDAQLAKLKPTDAASLAKFREVVGTALRVMVGGGVPDQVLSIALEIPDEVKASVTGVDFHYHIVDRIDERGGMPVLTLTGPKADPKRVVVWLDSTGGAGVFAGGKIDPTARRMAANCRVVTPDVVGVGKLRPRPASTVLTPQHGHVFGGYTFGYNRTLLADRVRDVLTAIAYAKSLDGINRVDLVGWGEFGPVAILASALAGDAVTKTAADVNRFRFDTITKLDDPMMLPGAVKYGGLGAFLGLCAPRPVLAYKHVGSGIGQFSNAAYKAAGAEDKLEMHGDAMSPEEVAKWLIA